MQTQPTAQPPKSTEIKEILQLLEVLKEAKTAEKQQTTARQQLYDAYCNDLKTLVKSGSTTVQTDTAKYTIKKLKKAFHILSEPLMFRLKQA